MSQYSQDPPRANPLIRLEGRLNKKYSLGYIKRYFVLDQSILACYKSKDHCLKPNAIPQLYDIRECELDVTEKNKSDFQIKITPPKKPSHTAKILKIGFSQRQEFEAWICALNSCQLTSVSKEVQIAPKEKTKKSKVINSETIIRRYALPREQKSVEPLSPDQINIALDKGNIKGQYFNPFLSVIVETQNENTFISPRSGINTEKVATSPENYQEQYKSIRVNSPYQHGAIYCTPFQIQSQSPHSQGVSQKSALGITPYNEKICSDLIFDERMHKLKCGMESIFQSCHSTCNIKQTLGEQKRITDALSYLETVIEESYLVKASKEDSKKIFQVIEDCFEYYKAILENKSRELIIEAKRMNKDFLSFDFYRECKLYSNEMLKTQSMYTTYLNKLILLDNYIHVFCEESTEGKLERVKTENDVKQRIEKRIHKKFFSLRVLNAILLFVNNCYRKTELYYFQRVIKIYGV